MSAPGPANARHVLRNGFEAGETKYGTFMMLKSGATARVVASSGWDFVLVDCEHGNIGDSDMHDSVASVAACGVSPIVRVREANVALVKRALDTGAHGIMLPMINTAAEAKAAVNYCKFPPVGIRGQGSPFAPWAHSLSIPDYIQQANKSLLTIAQIETKEGLQNAEEIAAVEGIDCIFIGPNDLSLCLVGFAPADFKHARYLEALDAIVAATRKAGKKLGILMPDGQMAKWAKDRWQVDMLALGTDVKAVQLWMGAELGKAKV